jgi:hypothetical protein
MSDDLVLFPVTEWEIRIIPSYQAVFIRLAFLSHALQKPEESDPGRRYVFQPAQLRELRDAIDRALQRLEAAGPQAPPGEAH